MFHGTQVISVITVNLRTCNSPFLFYRVSLSLKSTEVRISYVLVLSAVCIQVISVVASYKQTIMMLFLSFLCDCGNTLTFLMFFKDSYISCMIISDSWTYILVFHHCISEHPDECERSSDICAAVSGIIKTSNLLRLPQNPEYGFQLKSS